MGYIVVGLTPVSWYACDGTPCEWEMGFTVPTRDELLDDTPHGTIEDSEYIESIRKPSGCYTIVGVILDDDDLPTEAVLEINEEDCYSDDEDDEEDDDEDDEDDKK